MYALLQFDMEGGSGSEKESACVCVVHHDTFVKIRFRHDSAVKSGMQAMQNT